jgi:hypothetical protein
MYCSSEEKGFIIFVWRSKHKGRLFYIVTLDKKYGTSQWERVNWLGWKRYNATLIFEPDDGINRFDTRSLQRFMIEAVLNRFNTGLGKERQNCCCAQKPTE